MIHHCDVVTTPRRVTIIPAVPEAAPPRASRAALSVVAVVVLLLIALTRTVGSQPAAARPDTAKVARAINWTSDRRAFSVGDVLQVWVDEYALAEANKSTSNSASRRRRMDIGISPPTLPGGASPLGETNASIETGDGGDSRQRGSASRDTRYVGELAVRVIAVTPEGLLQVKGTKTIDVDKNKTTLTLSGFVRPIDIGARDIVRSETIADAQISYAAPKGLGKPKNGIVSKILGLFWP